jgi:pimeloyl-ACP methyl ester carboxylesterase
VSTTITPEDWRARGKDIAVPEGKVFALDEGQAGTPVLVLHGFPTSSWDFADAAKVLAHYRRVVLFDFLGFGFSDKPHDAGYSIFEHADVAITVAKKFELKRVHLWAHDMGTSVATELLARRERGNLPFDIASLVLMNGSVHVEMASLTAGQRILRSPAAALFARIASKRVFVTQMNRIFVKKPDPAVVDGMWSLLTRADGQLRLPSTIRYVTERTTFKRRWIGALERIDIPSLVAWGAKDPVAKMAIGEKLAKETPGADLVSWDDLGHYPQVEDPKRVADAVAAFYARVDQGLARGPTSVAVRVG